MSIGAYHHADCEEKQLNLKTTLTGYDIYDKKTLIGSICRIPTGYAVASVFGLLHGEYSSLFGALKYARELR